MVPWVAGMSATDRDSESLRSPGPRGLSSQLFLHRAPDVKTRPARQAHIRPASATELNDKPQNDPLVFS